MNPISILGQFPSQNMGQPPPGFCGMAPGYPPNHIPPPKLLPNMNCAPPNMNINQMPYTSQPLGHPSNAGMSVPMMGLSTNMLSPPPIMGLSTNMLSPPPIMGNLLPNMAGMPHNVAQPPPNINCFQTNFSNPPPGFSTEITSPLPSYQGSTTFNNPRPEYSPGMMSGVPMTVVPPNMNQPPPGYIPQVSADTFFAPFRLYRLNICH